MSSTDIRIATEADLPIILKMAEEFVREANYSELTDPEQYAQMALDILRADKKDKIVLISGESGMLAGMTSRLPFSYKKVAMELMWWVHPEHRNSKIGSELLEAFEYWAKAIGAEYVNMVCLDERVGKFYEHNGYKLYERVYMKEVK